MFRALRLIFRSTESVESHFHIFLFQTHFRRFKGVRYRFHVLHSRTHFGRYRGCRVPFSCFPLPNSFLTVPKAQVVVFMFCALGPVLGCTKTVRCRYHLLFSRTHFWMYRGRQIPFSCFTLPDKFSTVPRALGPIFVFCALGLISSGPRASSLVFMFSAHGPISGKSEGAEYNFLVSHSRTRFRPDTGGVRYHFHVFRCRTHFRRYEGIGSRFHVLHSRTRFGRYRVCQVSFSCFALPDSFSTIFIFHDLELVWGNTKGARSRFHVLRSSTRFRRYRGCLVPFAYFALPGSFSAVSRASSSVFMFCASVFDGTEGVISLFLILRSQTCFWRYRGRQISFSCFTLLDSIWALLSTSYPFFMFCAPVLVFDDTEGVRSRFHVLRSQTRLRRFQRRRLQFSCFAIPDSFRAILRASGPDFMFCTAVVDFDGTEGV
jgi:hypothetical protein